MKQTPDRDPKTFGYARASTDTQEESADTQKGIIAAYAARAGLGDVTYFVDAATSGKTAIDSRIAGKELLRQIRPGDSFVISKLDRAFRSLKDCAIVLDRFERLGIKLHICNFMGGAVDLSHPMSKAMVQMLAVFAELEAKNISERTKEGLAKRKRKNVAHTRFPGYGFRWKKVQIEGKWTKVRERDDGERNVMRSILSWRMQDQPLSWKEISDHLTYTLKIKTKDGSQWDVNRVRRACQAELLLLQTEIKAAG